MIPSDNFDSMRKNKGGYIVKLFGKKTLALLLALSMVMSVCVFAGDAKTLIAGQSVQLAAPAGATVVGWESSDDAVASVNNGTVTGVAAGTATITLTYTPAATTEVPEPAQQTEDWSVTVVKDEITAIALKNSDNATIEIPYGTAFSASSLNGIKLVATYGAAGNKEISATWTLVGEALGTAVGSTATYQATVAKLAEGVTAPTVTVKVVKAEIKSYTAIADIEVPLGTMGNVVAAKFPKTVKVKLQDNSEKTLTVGQELGIAGSYDNTGSAAATFPFKLELSEAAAANYTLGCEIKFNVKTKTAWTLSQITMSAVIEGDDDTVPGLDEEIEYAIETALGKSVSSSSISYDFTSGYYGAVGDTTGTYTVNLTDSEEEKLYEDGYLTDTINYKATCGGVEYTGSIKLTMYTTDVSATFTYAGGTLSAIASRIDSMMGGKLEAIEFEELDLEGGVLWFDNKYEEEVYEDEYYTPSELADMVYLPNGSGETSYLSYVAYDDYDADDDEVSDYADYIEGTIMLYADEFLLLTAEITSEDVIDLDGATFEDAFLDLNSDYEYLDYVTFTKPASGDGYLYVEYDEDDNKHTSIGSSTKYYVEHDDKALIDDITYVPGKDTEGVVNVKFKAIGYDDDEDKVTVDGIMQITVTVAADITIQAGKEQTVEIDPDLFLEYIEDVDTSNKDLEIVSVAITGAPYQAKKGYLVTDGEELTKSGVKTFYADEDDVDVDKKKYDLFDLYFLGGEKDGIVEATFKVTYLREGSTTKRTAEGTIDFVTGAAAAGNTMNGTLQASKTMSFGENVTLNAFKALGGNDNEYVTFSSLPVGGKLVYNWGLPTQEDVKVGTEYYLSYKAGKKLMQNVTFVPSYSSVKTQKLISIDVKGFNAKGKATNGTINITLNHASYSSKFYDITTSTYADSVDFLANQNITTGMTATTFGPNNNVTRAQFVTFLWRAAGQPAVTGVTNKFTDVKSTGTYSYAYQAILWAVQNNITTGRSATKFDPAANVTHQELLTFLYRYDVNYLKHSGTTSSYVNYTDYASVSAYAQVPVKWADYKGILTGYAIQPTVAGTRATVALWLHRMLTL